LYTLGFPSVTRKKENAETYFSTEQPAPRQNARFSDPHENGRRTGRAFPPPRRRPQEAERQLGEVAGIPDVPVLLPAQKPVRIAVKTPVKNGSAFPKSVRLLRPGDFRRVYDNGTRYTCPFFAAFCLSDLESPGPRVGFTTPRALGKAVVRNRLRRRVREAVRLELALLSNEWSIVFNPRRKTLDCAFTELQAEVRRLFVRCTRDTQRASEERSAKSLPDCSSGTNV
jgi:ribonuclease P protein component